MPRSRMIKPDFWSDGKVVKLSFAARLLFVGMWNFADDRGVIENIDRKLLGDIFPFDECVDECVVKKLKQEIYHQGFFKLVEQKGKTFIVLKNFTKHQKIDKPSKSTFIDYSMPIKEIKSDTLPDSIADTLPDSIAAEIEVEIEVEKKKKKIDKKEKPSVPSGSISFEEFSELFQDKFVDRKDIVFPEWIDNTTTLKQRLIFYLFDFRPKTNKKLKNTGTAITRIIKRMEDDCGKCSDVALANLEYSITKSYDMIYPDPRRQHTVGIVETKPFDIVEYAKENIEKLQANPTGPNSWKNTLISVLQKNYKCNITEFIDQNIESLKAITDIVEFAIEIKTAVKHKED